MKNSLKRHPVWRRWSTLLGLAGMLLVACSGKDGTPVGTGLDNAAGAPPAASVDMTGVQGPDRQVLPPTEPVQEASDRQMTHVPAGLFAMGSENGGPEESPVHLVELDEYYIDTYEVTLGQYRACVDAGACLEPVEAPGCVWYRAADEDEPINCMTWYDASAYCAWAGLRLPTEAEWEKAARGVDGRTYPWGEGVDREKANYKGGFGRAVKVGSYPDGRSPYGIYDMAGNVWEWVEDRYDAEYYIKSPPRNPKGPDSGVNRVLRGGSWCFIANAMRSTRRVPYYVGTTDTDIGFRCARNAD